MDKKVNLIPEELTVPASVIKFSKLVNKSSVIIAILLVLSIISMIGIFVYFSITLNKVTVLNQSLKSEVSSLEKVEQQLVLTKDKISKVIIVNKTPSTETNLNKFQELYSIVSSYPDTKIGETNLTAKSIKISISGTDSTSFKDLLFKINEFNSFFAAAKINSLNYDPKTGFIMNIEYGI